MRALTHAAIAFIAAATPSVAQAQTLSSEQVEQLTGDVHRRLQAACGNSTETVRYRDVNAQRVEVYTGQWTGACVNGVRDGYGRYTLQVDSTAVMSDLTTHFIITRITEGTVVSGQRVGLWCTLSSRIDAEENQRQPACSLLSRAGGVGEFSRRADGSWRRADTRGVFTEPPEVYPAGALEAESDRVIAAARTGSLSTPINLQGQASALNDLVAGASIRLSADPSVTDLRGKRIAIVLSSRAVVELQNWTVERQAIIDRLQSFRRDVAFDEYFANFVRKSDPSRLVMGATATILSAGGVPFAAEDLSVLQDGRADYALVLDWQYEANIPTTLRELRAFPVCPVSSPCENGVMFASSFATYLVTPDMRAIVTGGWAQGRLTRHDTDVNTMLSLAVLLQSGAVIDASARPYLPGATYRSAE